MHHTQVAVPIGTVFNNFPIQISTPTSRESNRAAVNIFESAKLEKS
jgi:hypothetical protein